MNTHIGTNKTDAHQLGGTDMREYITTEHAKELLHCSKDTIYRYVREGLLDATKPRRFILISLSSVKTLLESNKIEAP